MSVVGKASMSSSMVQYVMFLVFLALAYAYYVYYLVRLWWTKPNNNKEDALEPTNDTASKTTRLVVITGADRGFGRELSEVLFDTSSFYVLALTLTSQAALELDEHCQSKESFDPPRLVGRQCDVSSEKDVVSMKQYVEAFLKDNPDMQLFAILNNAGQVDPGDFLWYEDIQAYQRIMDVNFFGQLRVTQALLPLLTMATPTLCCSSQSQPRIVNMSSVCGTSASPGNSVYTASKFAVEAWSDSLRLELMPFGISVVKVRPGQVQTQIQKDWLNKYVERFDSASDVVQKLYGGDAYIRKAREVFESGSGSPMTQSHVVVDTLKDILTVTKPKASYWIGEDAKTFWRALQVMHTDVGDTVKKAIFPPVPSMK